MNVRSMIDQLSLRLSDSAKKKFTDSYKRQALENAQYTLANLLHPAYLSNLKYTDTNVTVTTGVMAFSSLTYGVARGEQGILTVKDYASPNMYATPFTEKERKVMENAYMNATTRNPYFCVIGTNIYVYPTSITAVDVTYLRLPTTLRNAFTWTNESPSTTTILGNASQGLSTVNDFYNGAVVYIPTYNIYRTVKDYVGSTTRSFEFDYAYTTFGATTGTFYFLTHGHDELTLTSAYSDLNENLHTLMIDLAEAECWAKADNESQYIMVYETAMHEIESLNKLYTNPEGIGTNVQ